MKSTIIAVFFFFFFFSVSIPLFFPPLLISYRAKHENNLSYCDLILCDNIVVITNNKMLCEKQNLSLPRSKGQRVSRGQCGEKSMLIHKPLIILCSQALGPSLGLGII